MPEALQKEVYLLSEVADLLQVEIHTLYRWRKEGRFSAYKPAEGQQYRVRREEVARLLGRAESTTEETAASCGSGMETCETSTEGRNDAIT